MGADLVVRRALASDGPAMGAIHVDAQRAGYRGTMPDAHLDSLDPELRGRWWTARLEQGGGGGRCTTPDGEATALVADEHGRVLGIASVGPVRPEPQEGVGELWMLNVAPEAWGRGVGSLLLDGAVGLLRSQGYREAVLWAVDRNRRARDFYERRGWVADGGAKTSWAGCRAEGGGKTSGAGCRAEGGGKEDHSRGFVRREVRYRRSL